MSKKKARFPFNRLVKQIKIRFNNSTFDGRLQWFYFFVMDLNDFFGKPFLFINGDDNTYQNFKINYSRMKKDSTKYDFAMKLERATERQAKQTINTHVKPQSS
ncbi:MAG: hypothetical protein GY861_03120 [bacterium]|nr:hypothetical protein [bacterium]